MKRMKKLIHEPLVHFLLIGAALFLVFGLTREQDNNASNRIVVTQEEVAQLAATFSRTWLRPPREDELNQLIKNYVRDAIYYREAVAMGLDQNDPQVRRRMRLKLEFILEDLTAEKAPGDDVLKAFMQHHPDKFMAETQISFRQVYFNPDKRRNLTADAERMRIRLNRGESPEAAGDPTMLPYECTFATRSDIARSFGEAFAREVVDLDPGGWKGPLSSGLGVHLVQVTDRVEGRLPALDQIRTQVEREYMAQRRQELKDKAYARLREGYEVVIQPPAAGGKAGEAVAAIRTAGAGQ